MALDLRSRKQRGFSNMRRKQGGYLRPFADAVLANRNVQPSFAVALQSSLTPSQALGSATASFSRASAAAHTDFEGIVRQVPAGAFRPQGARYVRNLLSTSEVFSGGFWSASNGTVSANVSDPWGGTTASTFTATSSNGILANAGAVTTPAGSSFIGAIYIRRRIGTGVIQIRGGGDVADVITTAVISSWQRLASSVQTAAGTSPTFRIILVTSGDAVDIARGQVENVTGQTLQTPSEYVPSLATANADSGAIGVRFFDYLNPCTVSNNIVTDNS